MSRSLLTLLDESDAVVSAQFEQETKQGFSGGRGGGFLCVILNRVAFPVKSSRKAGLRLQLCGLGCIYKLWPGARSYRSRAYISSRVTFKGCAGFRLALPSCGHAVALAGFLFWVSLPGWNSQILTLHHFTSYQSNLSVKKL